MKVVGSVAIIFSTCRSIMYVWNLNLGVLFSTRRNVFYHIVGGSSWIMLQLDTLFTVFMQFLVYLFVVQDYFLGISFTCILPNCYIYNVCYRRVGIFNFLIIYIIKQTLHYFCKVNHNKDILLYTRHIYTLASRVLAFNCLLLIIMW